MEQVNDTPAKKYSVFLAILVLVLVVAGVFLFFKSSDKMVPSKPQSVEDVKPSEDRKYMLEDISKHSTKEDCWTAINGEVFDVTNFISKHKGGDKILFACGIDATDIFTGKSPMSRVHSAFAVKLLSSMKIGLFDSGN